MDTHPNKTPHAAPLQDGVTASTRTSDASESKHPLTSDMRTALIDLANGDHTSILRHEDRKCILGVCLEKNGLVRFSTLKGPGRWVITQKGWLFLERRILTSQETR